MVGEKRGDRLNDKVCKALRRMVGEAARPGTTPAQLKKAYKNAKRLYKDNAPGFRERVAAISGYRKVLEHNVVASGSFEDRMKDIGKAAINGPA